MPEEHNILQGTADSISKTLKGASEGVAHGMEMVKDYSSGLLHGSQPQISEIKTKVEQMAKPPPPEHEIKEDEAALAIREKLRSKLH